MLWNQGRLGIYNIILKVTILYKKAESVVLYK